MRLTSRPPADGRRRLRRRAGEGDPAADQRDRARRVPLHLLEVVGREDDGAAARGDAVDDLPDAPPLARVERGGGLVEEEHVGPPEQRDRDVEPLQAADREPARRPVRLLEPDRPEQVPRLHLRLRETLEAGEELEVLPRGEVPVERGPLRRPARRARGAADLDPPLARAQRPREDAEQRRLPRAVRPDEREHLAGRDLDVGRLERNARAVAPRDPVRREQERAVAGDGHGAQPPTCGATISTFWS